MAPVGQDQYLRIKVVMQPSTFAVLSLLKGGKLIPQESDPQTPLLLSISPYISHNFIIIEYTNQNFNGFSPLFESLASITGCSSGLLSWKFLSAMFCSFKYKA